MRATGEETEAMAEMVPVHPAMWEQIREEREQDKKMIERLRAALLAIKSEVESEPTTMVAATSIHDIVKRALE